jgi:hypothetical protein
MIKTKKEKVEEVIVIPPFRVAGMKLFIVGTSALCVNRMAEKAKHELVFPARKSNRADKESRLKHNPVQEFRDSAYVWEDDERTRLCLPSRMLHKSMIEAAAATPGATKTELSWLLSIDSEFIPVWGIPKVSMKIVRQSGIGRAPDTRFRCLLPQWATIIDLNYLASRIDQTNVLNLVAGAGMLMGIGDFRAQKAGPWGRFRLCSDDDPQFVDIIKNGGKAAQEEALEAAEPVDYEAEEILSYYGEQLEKRKQDAIQQPLKLKRNERDGVKPRAEAGVR